MWKLATPEEKKRLRPWLVNKYKSLDSYPQPERREIKAAIGRALANMR